MLIKVDLEKLFAMRGTTNDIQHTDRFCNLETVVFIKISKNFKLTRDSATLKQFYSPFLQNQFCNKNKEQEVINHQTFFN